MNRELISKALNGVNDGFIAESMIYRNEKTHHASERTLKMGKYRNTTRRTKKLIALGIAVCLVFALVATVGAANLWGIRDMWKNAGREFPEQADDYIQQQAQTAQSEDLSCRITESLCTNSRIMVTVTVSCSDRYILVPTDASSGDPTAVIGITSNQTLGEYAAALNKELIFVGATLMKNKSYDITSEAQQFESISDSEMAILIQAEKKSDASLPEAVLTVYSCSQSGEKKETQLTFTLSESPVSGTSFFTPVDPDAIPGLHVGEATVTETPLGISIWFEETVADLDAFYNMEMICEEITGFEGGSTMDSDGKWYLRWSMGQGTVTDTLTVRIYDCETQQHIGDIVFKRK